MRIEGYASTPAVNRDGRSIEANAFGASPSLVRFLIDHDETIVAGEFTSLSTREPTETSAGGLWCTATLDMNRHYSREIAGEIARGEFYGFSVGAIPTVGYRTVTSATLSEISITKYPKNKECVVHWVDRPKPKLWPEELAKFFENQAATIASNKSNIERNQRWMTDKLAICGIRLSS